MVILSFLSVMNLVLMGIDVEGVVWREIVRIREVDVMRGNDWVEKIFIGDEVGCKMC